MNKAIDFLLRPTVVRLLIGVTIFAGVQYAKANTSYQNGYKYGVAICERRVHEMGELTYFKHQTKDVEKGLRDGLGTCGETF